MMADFDASLIDDSPAVYVRAEGGEIRALFIDGSESVDPGEPPETDPPTITNVSPAEGALLTPASRVQFDVTDASSLAALLVLARYPSGAYEVVHDGSAFAAAFSTSTRTTISGGYRYVLRRARGWREAPTFSVVAVDVKGNAA